MRTYVVGEYYQKVMFMGLEEPVKWLVKEKICANNKVKKPTKLLYAGNTRRMGELQEFVPKGCEFKHCLIYVVDTQKGSVIDIRKSIELAKQN